ncbi:MAG: hypothetical protein ACOX52_10680 [Verrucomicrobiota bacterium]
MLNPIPRSFDSEPELASPLTFSDGLLLELRSVHVHSEAVHVHVHDEAASTSTSTGIFPIRRFALGTNGHFGRALGTDFGVDRRHLLSFHPGHTSDSESDLVWGSPASGLADRDGAEMETGLDLTYYTLFESPQRTPSADPCLRVSRHGDAT